MFFFSEADHPVALFAAHIITRAGFEAWVGDKDTLCPPNSVGVYTNVYTTKTEFALKRPGAKGLGIQAYPDWIVPCWQCIVIPRFTHLNACQARTHLLDAFAHMTPLLEPLPNMLPS